MQTRPERSRPSRTSTLPNDMNTPVYVPVGPQGEVGPEFGFASLACLWIIATQSNITEWSWESRAPVPFLVSPRRVETVIRRVNPALLKPTL